MSIDFSKLHIHIQHAAFDRCFALLLCPVCRQAGDKSNNAKGIPMGKLPAMNTGRREE